MKIAGIICALAFVASVNGVVGGIDTVANPELETHDPNPYEPSAVGQQLQICEPGTTRKEDCNNCFCIPNGSGWACTRMMCLENAYVYPESVVKQLSQKNP